MCVDCGVKPKYRQYRRCLSCKEAREVAAAALREWNTNAQAKRWRPSSARTRQVSRPRPSPASRMRGPRSTRAGRNAICQQSATSTAGPTASIWRLGSRSRRTSQFAEFVQRHDLLTLRLGPEIVEECDGDPLGRHHRAPRHADPHHHRPVQSSAAVDKISSLR